MSSSVNIDNENKDILILSEETTQGLDDTTLTAEAKYPINLTIRKSPWWLPPPTITTTQVKANRNVLKLKRYLVNNFFKKNKGDGKTKIQLTLRKILIVISMRDKYIVEITRVSARVECK